MGFLGRGLQDELLAMNEGMELCFLSFRLKG